MKTTTFKDMNFGTIVNIYTGEEAGCRCGCHGRYFDPGEKGYVRALNKINRLNPMVYMPEPEDDLNQCLSNDHRGSAVSNILFNESSNEVWVDLWLPNDKTITVYFRKI